MPDRYGVYVVCCMLVIFHNNLTATVFVFSDYSGLSGFKMMSSCCATRLSPSRKPQVYLSIIHANLYFSLKEFSRICGTRVAHWYQRGYACLTVRTLSPPTLPIFDIYKPAYLRDPGSLILVKACIPISVTSEPPGI